MKKKKPKILTKVEYLLKIRKPTCKGSIPFVDKKKYNRKNNRKNID